MNQSGERLNFLKKTIRILKSAFNFSNPQQATTRIQRVIKSQSLRRYAKQHFHSFLPLQ